jgi:hypothetical protein
MSQTPSQSSIPPRLSAWRNPFFSLCAALSLAFVITVFALVATMFGNPQSPANKFLDQQGLMLIGLEVGGILISGFAAMVLDQWTSRRR